MAGQVGILNVGAGDTKLVFDNSNSAETANAARIVKDMIRRGFAIFIEIGRNEKGPIYQRAHDFDETTAEYIVVGTPDDQAKDKPHRDTKQKSPTPRRSPAKAGKERRRIAANSTDAVAVARTAGG